MKFIDELFFNKVLIDGDGNCFFRTLSYYFEGTQNNFQTYRNYIYNFAKINYNNLKDNFEYIIRDGKNFIILMMIIIITIQKYPY